MPAFKESTRNQSESIEHQYRKESPHSTEAQIAKDKSLRNARKSKKQG